MVIQAIACPKLSPKWRNSPWLMKEMSEYVLTADAVAWYAVTLSIAARTVKVLAATRQRSLAVVGILAVLEN